MKLRYAFLEITNPSAMLNPVSTAVETFSPGDAFLPLTNRVTLIPRFKGKD
jgi:hypothetical protein